MAAIVKRRTRDGELRYRVLVRIRGFPPQSATFPRKAEATRWAQQTEAAIREGRYFRRGSPHQHTLAELADRYVEDVLAERPLRRRQDQERHLDFWKKELGAVFLGDVTPSLIAEKRDKLARGNRSGGARRAAATVNRYLGSLSHAFTIASREWEWIEQNPVRRVRRLQEPRGRVRFLSDEERSRLLAACRESTDRRLYPLVVLALSTGARVGELLQLRWQDVDLGRRMAVVHHTKNRERRALQLAGHALEVLKDLARVRRLGSDFVFAGKTGRPTFPRWLWEDALEEAGIEDFRFHDLRHSAASYLAMSGATLAEIAEVLGHKTLAMVKRYAHLTDQHTSKVVARMNERIFGSPPA